MHLFHFGCLSLTMSHSLLKAHGVSLQGNPILLLCHLYRPLRLFIAGKRVECACCPLSVSADDGAVAAVVFVSCPCRLCWGALFLVWVWEELLWVGTSQTHSD